MPASIPELAADVDAVAERLGNGISVGASVGGRCSTGGSRDVLRPGSITKVLTATAVMQCVDVGLLALDDPASRWVPFLDPRITIRHLLSHSSGLDAGDVFVDTGDGDDCLERYVALLAGPPQLFPPGHTFSYSNGGMIVAGHIASLVRGQTYEQVLEQHIFGPAGMETARFEPEHNGNPICSRALAPAGGTLACSATDLVRFAVAPLVTPVTATLMRTRQVDSPGGVAPMTGSGLGWQLWRNDHGETIRHGGAYPGHAAVLVVDPASDVALALMMPFAPGIASINALLDAQEVVPRDEPPPALDAYVGEYVSHAVHVRVDLAEGGGLQMSMNGLPPGPITPVDRSTFLFIGAPFAFFDFGFDERGGPRYLRFRMRVQRRV